MTHTTLVTGTLASLEGELAAAIAGARHGDPLAPTTVLVGNVLLRPYLRRMLARRGVPLLNVHFLRPNELAHQMAAASGTSAKPSLTPAADRLLVREIADAASGYFGVIAGRQGFADALRRLFREIEQGGFDADGFAAAVAHGDEKADELARLYRRYRERRAGFASIADNYGAALSQTPETPLIVYGLWQPAHLQMQLIEHCARSAGATILLPESGLDVDAAHAAFRERIMAIEGATHRTAAAATTATIAERVFRAPVADAPPIGAPSVALTNAPDTVREIWEAARTCLRWASEGIRFHEMAIAYRHREPYRALIDEIFGEAGIETYLHDGRLLSTHPLGRRVLSLLSLAASHETFERAPVMEFLTETVLPPDTKRRWPAFRPAAWETFTREAAVIEGIGQWRERLPRLASEMIERAKDPRFSWLADKAGRVHELLQFAEAFHAALAQRPGEATWGEHLAFLRGLCATYADGTEPLLDALKDLAALAAVQERVPFETFARAVREDFESRDTSRVLNEPVRLFGRQGVAVIDASSLRHLRFRAVCLVGVAERAWPPPSRPDPLLLEHERKQINAAGHGELPLRTEPDEEPLGFWLALQSADEHLSISYARADAGRSGRHLPSYFFRAVAEAIDGRPAMTLDDLAASSAVTRFEAGRLAARDIATSLSAAEYDRGLIRAANEGDLAGAIEAITAAAPAFGRARDARAQRRAYALTPYDGLMTTAEAQAAALKLSAFAQGKPVSASRLELYATCPYQFFLRYGLGVEPIEEPEKIERMDHLQRGSMVHEILQLFLERLGRDDPPRAERRPEHLRILQEVADMVGEDRVARGVTGRPLIWGMDKKAIDEDLVRWYDAELKDGAPLGLRPGAFEARFGPLSPGFGTTDEHISRDEPLTLRTAGGREIRVQGRIDRVDWNDDRTAFRVIDYKTGQARHKEGNRLEGGTALQLPIYLFAAAEMLDMPAESGESQYFFVSSAGRFKRHRMSGASVTAERDVFDQTLETIADGVDGGYFAPHPGEPQCGWCDFRAVCDVRIDTIMQRKADDPRATAYAAMKELQ